MSDETTPLEAALARRQGGDRRDWLFGTGVAVVVVVDLAQTDGAGGLTMVVDVAA